MTFEGYVKELAYLYKLPVSTIINKIATSQGLNEYIIKLDEEHDVKILKEKFKDFNCSLE